MHTLKLYRIEHRVTRKGPFYDCGPAMLMNASNMPGPFRDFARESFVALTKIEKYMREHQAIFAFPSREAMLKYFPPPDLEKLQRLGYRVVKLRVPPEKIKYLSEHQAIVPTTTSHENHTNNTTNQARA